MVIVELILDQTGGDRHAAVIGDLGIGLERGVGINRVGIAGENDEAVARVEIVDEARGGINEVPVAGARVIHAMQRDVIGRAGVFIDIAVAGDDAVALGDIDRLVARGIVEPVVGRIDIGLRRARELVHRHGEAVSLSGGAFEGIGDGGGLVGSKRGDRGRVLGRHPDLAICGDVRIDHEGLRIHRRLAIECIRDRRIADQRVDGVEKQVRGRPADRVEGKQDGDVLRPGLYQRLVLRRQVGGVGGFHQHVALARSGDFIGVQVTVDHPRGGAAEHQVGGGNRADGERVAVAGGGVAAR